MDAATIAAGVSATVVASGGIITGVRCVRRLTKRVRLFLDDWAGEEARPGVDATPGVMEQLKTLNTTMGDFDARLHGVEAQLSPNGGSSLHDRVTAIERKLS